MRRAKSWLWMLFALVVTVVGCAVIWAKYGWPNYGPGVVLPLAFFAGVVAERIRARNWTDV